ncbi:hypothetical protein ACSSS7_005825 [Eimeria intestinalis]
MACMPLLSEDDLCRFRTKSCRRLSSGGCDFGLARCQYSHNKHWHRRCPVYVSDHSFIRYVHLLCPKVQLLKNSSSSAVGGEAAPQCVSSCERGWECPFAHSREEALYHPLVYKTALCQRYQRGACSVYYCPYIHSLSEARQPRCYRLPFTSGIDIPPIPNVLVVSHIAKSPKVPSAVCVPSARDQAEALGLGSRVPFQQGGRCEGAGGPKALTAEGLGDSSSSSSSPKVRGSKKQHPSSPSSCSSSSEPSEAGRHSRKQDAKRDKKRGSLFNSKSRREALSSWLTDKLETESEEAQNHWKENFQGILRSPAREGTHASAPPLLHQHQQKQQQQQQRQQQQQQGPESLTGDFCPFGLLDVNPSAVACDPAATETAPAPAAPKAVATAATATGAAGIGLEGGAEPNYRGLLGVGPAWGPLTRSQPPLPLEGNGFLDQEAWGVRTAQLSLSHPPLSLNVTETPGFRQEGLQPAPLNPTSPLFDACAPPSFISEGPAFSGPRGGQRNSSPALLGIVSCPASSLHEGSISGGDGGAADSDDSTAFSYSPPLNASNPASLLSPPYPDSLKEDTSSFLTNCLQERDEAWGAEGECRGGGFSLVCRSEESGEETEALEKLERAVNVLCEDWAENGPSAFNPEVDLRFGTFDQQQQQQLELQPHQEVELQHQQQQQLDASMEEGKSTFPFAPGCTMLPDIQVYRHLPAGAHTQAWWGSSVLFLPETQDGGGL